MTRTAFALSLSHDLMAADDRHCNVEARHPGSADCLAAAHAARAYAAGRLQESVVG